MNIEDDRFEYLAAGMPRIVASVSLWSAKSPLSSSLVVCILSSISNRMTIFKLRFIRFSRLVDAKENREY